MNEINLLRNQIEALTKERDALKAELARPESTAVSMMRAENAELTAQLETLQYEVDAIPGIKAERDEYAACADTMAAAHKVERDALKELAILELRKALDAEIAQAVLASAIFNSVIDFAVQHGIDASEFLYAWREGDTSEWPEFTHPPQPQATTVAAWKAEQIDDYEIRVTSPEGESWRLRSADKNDIFNNFIWRWAKSMITTQGEKP